MNQQLSKLPGNPNWQPGVSGNPAGRKPGSRQRIAEALLKDVADLWEERGAEALRHLANEDVKAFVQIAAGLLPREVAASLTVQQAPPGNLTGPQWLIMRDLLDVIEAAAAGADRERVLEALGQFLRSELAVVLPAPMVVPKCPVPLPDLQNS